MDAQALLDTLAATPVQEYNLKSLDFALRHIGPVAQDFAAFGYGESERAINLQDADGVALAMLEAGAGGNPALGGAVRARYRLYEEATRGQNGSRGRA